MTKLEKILSQLVDAGTISFNEKEALKACVEVASEDPDVIPDNTVLAGLFTLNKENHSSEVYCSFCGRSEKLVSTLVRGKDKDAAICDYCVILCKEIVEEEL